VILVQDSKLQANLLTYLAEAIIQDEIIQILNECFCNDAAVTSQYTNQNQPVFHQLVQWRLCYIILSLLQQNFHLYVHNHNDNFTDIAV